MKEIKEEYGNDAFYIQYGTGVLGGTVSKSWHPDQTMFARLMNLWGGYLRQYAGSKTYSSLKMKPLQQASAQTAARAAESRTGSIETGGQRFTTYLTGERVAVPAKASGSTAAKVPAEGKRLRTPADPQPAQPKTGFPLWAEVRFFHKIAKNGVSA